jgi:hypothetical protein
MCLLACHVLCPHGRDPEEILCDDILTQTCTKTPHKGHWPPDNCDLSGTIHKGQMPVSGKW